jgi:hypothetical protein
MSLPSPTHRIAQTQNKRTETFMHRVGFEPSTLVFLRAKTVHAPDGAAAVIGNHSIYALLENQYFKLHARRQSTKQTPRHRTSDQRFSIPTNLKYKTDVTVVNLVQVRNWTTNDKIVNVTVFWDTESCSLICTNISEECITSIFRAEIQPRRKLACSVLPRHLLHDCFLLGCFLAFKMEAIRSSETLVHIWTTRRCIPEDRNIHNYPVRASNPEKYFPIIFVYNLCRTFWREYYIISAIWSTLVSVGRNSSTSKKVNAEICFLTMDKMGRRCNADMVTTYR